LYGVISQVIGAVPLYELECLPNVAAAQVCAAAVSG